jgi:small subunit ribosomal protein S10
MTKSSNLQLYIRFKSFHPSYLNRLISNLQQELHVWGLSRYSLVFLPKRVERFTVLRSPHVDKKARDQFERVTYQRLLVVNLANKQTLLAYRLLRHIAASALGVEVRVRYVTKLSRGAQKL